MKRVLRVLCIVVALLVLLALTIGSLCANQKPVRDQVSAVTVTGISMTTPHSDNTATFTWNASTDGDTGVEYYLVSVDGGEWLNVGDVTTYVLITALSPGTHTFKVRAVDEAGNQATSGNYVFSVYGDVDASPPAISGVTAVAGAALTATVTWMTDEPATSQVEYGPTASYGLSTTFDVNPKTSHSVTLTGLTSATTYHYRVVSGDADGNEAVSTDRVFATPSPDFALGVLMVSPAEALSGQQVSIGTRVENVGTADGVYVAELIINDHAVETRDVTVRVGSTAVVTFNVSRTAPGVYDVAIGDRSGSFTITAPASKIIVTVKDEETGKPIGKIYGVGYPSIILDGVDRGYVTDYGQIAIDGLTAGTHLLKVDIPTYGDRSKYVDVELGAGEEKSVTVEIDMPNPVYDVSVTSRTYDTGLPFGLTHDEFGDIKVTLTNIGDMNAVSPTVKVLVYPKSKDGKNTINYSQPIATHTLNFDTLPPTSQGGASQTLRWPDAPYVYGPLEVIVVAVYDNWEWTPASGPWAIHGVLADPGYLARLSEAAVTWLEGHMGDILDTALVMIKGWDSN